MVPLLPLSVALLLLLGLAFRGLFAYSQDGNDRVEGGSAARLADLVGISFSLIALGGMATFFLGIRMPAAALLLIAGFLVAAAAWSVFRPAGRVKDRQAGEQALWPEALPLLGFAALVFFRFYQARTLALPAWVDSIHHTLLVRLILETGGLPPSFEPYMPVPLYYHAGFHVNTALFAFFSRLDPARAVLLFGQLLNASVGLAIYRLGIAIWGDWRRSLVAMLLAGFAFQMPAYYLTWGRYTLLAGVMLMALAMAAALEISRGQGGRGTRARLVVLTAGLALTHYFAALVFALFLAVLLFDRLLSERAFLRSASFRRLAGAVGLGALLALPWIVHVLLEATAFIRLDVVSPAQSADEAYYAGYLDYLWFLLGPTRSHVLHGIAMLGLLLLGWRRPVRPLALFTIVFGLLSLPWGVHLAPFRPDHGVILAFLPGSLLAADVLVTPLEGVGAPAVRRLTSGLFWAALAGLLIWGVVETRSIINPVTVLADGEDVRAVDWIAQNTPARAVFFINTAFWQGGAYRGVDGGWWITPLTGRKTLLPPVLYLNGTPDYAESVIATTRRAAGITTCDAAFWDLVEEERVTHVYLKTGVGSLQPSGLEGCGGVRLVYAQGGISVYEVQGR